MWHLGFTLTQDLSQALPSGENLRIPIASHIITISMSQDHIASIDLLKQYQLKR
jgi:hypothetical protein